MGHTVASRSRYGKGPDHPRGQGPRAVRVAYASASDAAAQKKIGRAFRGALEVAQVLALQGSTLPIVQHIARLNEVLESGPVEPITQAFRVAGRVDRAEDESREDCLVGGCTPAELDLEEARTLRQISEGYAVLRAIRAHRGPA